jgi:hypothetical protein
LLTEFVPKIIALPILEQPHFSPKAASKVSKIRFETASYKSGRSQKKGV